MRDISEKPITLRIARASGIVFCSSGSLDLLESGRLPKGSALDTARAAGLLASKKTDSLIPHCHPVSIDGMQIDFEPVREGRPGIRILCEGKSIGRTGIEMEVLTAVCVTALTLYDLLKPVDKDLEISEVRLLDKKGGKSDRMHESAGGRKACVLVCSDSVFQGSRKDTSGAAIAEILTSRGVEVREVHVCADDIAAIQEKIKEWVKAKIDFIITTGGTGPSPRDVTVEAVRPMLHRELEGFGEMMRAHGSLRTPFAAVSRSLGGSIGDSMILVLPGSEKGARESLTAGLSALLHAKSMLDGGGH